MTNDLLEIHYDELEQVARSFETASEQMAALRTRLRSESESLGRSGWQGHGWLNFERELGSEVLPALQRLAQALEEAGRGTRDVIAILDAAEAEAAAVFQARSAGAAAPAVLGSAAGDPGADFDLLKTVFGGSKGFLEFMSTIASDRGAARNFMLGLGRVVNRLTGQAGGVGRAKALYDRLIVDGLPRHSFLDRLLDHRTGLGKVFKGALTAADIGMAMAEDQRTGRYGDLATSFRVHATQAGVEIAAGTPMLVNTGVQWLGSANAYFYDHLADSPGVSGQLSAGLKENAAAMRDALPRANLENVTLSLAESVTRHFGAGELKGLVMMSHPVFALLDPAGAAAGRQLVGSAVAATIRDVTPSVLSTADGLFDLAVSYGTATGAAFDQAVKSLVVDQLPLPPAWRQRVDANFAWNLQQDNAAARTLINLF